MATQASGPQDYERAIHSGGRTDRWPSSNTDHTAVQRFQHALHTTPSLVPLIVLLASIIGFGVLVGSNFFSAFALTLILKQVAVTGIVGAAQSLVILTAGIELSVGAIMVICTVIMGQFTFNYGMSGADLDPVRPAASAR